LGGSNPTQAKSADNGNPSISPAVKGISKEKRDGKKEVPLSFAFRDQEAFLRGKWAFGDLFIKSPVKILPIPGGHPPADPPSGPPLDPNKKTYLKKHHENPSTDAQANPESHNHSTGAPDHE
jgi:hypothetical protein